MRIRTESGFALPSVIIAGTILFGMMAILLGSVASTRTVLDAQFYEALARDAAESGAAHARACFDNAAFTDSVTLTPETNCAGATQSGLPPYVVDTTASPNVKYRTSYKATAASSSTYGRSITATGSVELIRASDNSVWKTYTYSLRGDSNGDVLASNVIFGYANSSSGGCLGGHFMVVTNDNRIMGVGNNTCGQLGVGNTTNQLKPVEVTLPSGVSLSSSVSPAIFMHNRSGGVHSAVIGSDGYAYITGLNYAGHTGWGDTKNPITVFRRFGGESATDYGPVSYIGVFATNVYVVAADGRAWVAGECKDGLGGYGYSIADCTKITVPQPIGGVSFYKPLDTSTHVVKIIGDNKSRHALMKDGTVYSWGDNSTGALGITSSYTQTAQPIKALYTTSFATDICAASTKPFGGTNVKATDVYDTGGVSFVLGDDNILYSAGTNTGGLLGYGVLGNGGSCPPNATADGYFVYSPFSAFKPALKSGETIRKAATDQGMVAIITSKGSVYTAGTNQYGMLGCGDYSEAAVNGCPPNDSTDPAQLDNTKKTATAQLFKLPPSVTGEDVIAPMSALADSGPGVITSANVFVLGSDGNVYGAGTNTHGELGDGCTGTGCKAVNATPVKMLLPAGVRAVSVTGGRATTVVRTADGAYYATGRNDTGQLGSGDTVDSSTPTAYRYMNIHDVRYF